MAHHGSSPLARGLRVGVMVTYTVHRIIPARAGFTLSWTFTDPRPPDHPRSRGVYLGRDANVYCGGGSSPLARGLRRRDRGDRNGSGIIPARAGFTRGALLKRTRSRDHPRSRGVYSAGVAIVGDYQGSSPLARGLPCGWRRPAVTCRIIPARAGFTPAGTSHPGSARDHPRSRGVYACPRKIFSRGVGSSPLARGLPNPPGG